MARTADSMTPAASPRQPAWAAATTVPAVSQSSTGRQSAVSTAQTVPGARENAASASAPAAHWSAHTTWVPCTWVSHTGSLGTWARSRRRFSATAAGSSPTWAPRLSEA